MGRGLPAGCVCAVVGIERADLNMCRGALLETLQPPRAATEQTPPFCVLRVLVVGSGFMRKYLPSFVPP